MESQKPDSKLTVLVMSDNPDLRSKIGAFIDDEYRVLADTPDVGRSMLDRGGFNVLIADFFVFKTNVVNLLAMAKHRYPHMVLIVMTDANTPKLPQKIADLSRITFIQKPFTASQLKVLITQRLKNVLNQMEPLSAYDLVLLYCLSLDNLALTVNRNARNRKEQGNIYFEKGKITNATFGNVRGEEAFYYLITWKDLQFTERKGVVVKQKDILSNWEDLFTEAGKRINEELASMATLEFLVDDLFKTPEAENDTKQPNQMSITPVPGNQEPVLNLLNELKTKSEDLENAIVIDMNGNILGSLDPETARQFGDMISKMITFSEGTSNDLNLGLLDETIIFCEKGITILFPIQKIGVLGVMAQDGNIGMLRWGCKEAVAQMKKIFL